MRNVRWLRLLAYVTGSVNQDLLMRNEYLAAENRILRAKLPTRLRLGDPERATLAEIAKRLGRKALREVACVAKPDTILAWYRRLIAQKFDGSKHRRYPGRPPVSSEVEALVVRMARENSGWGYDRIVGALANLGHHVSDQTVGNILRRHGIPPAPKRSKTTTWKDFLATHMNVLGRLVRSGPERNRALANAGMSRIFHQVSAASPDRVERRYRSQSARQRSSHQLASFSVAEPQPSIPGRTTLQPRDGCIH